MTGQLVTIYLTEKQTERAIELIEANGANRDVPILTHLQEGLDQARKRRQAGNGWARKVSGFA